MEVSPPVNRQRGCLGGQVLRGRVPWENSTPEWEWDVGMLACWDLEGIFLESRIQLLLILLTLGRFQKGLFFIGHGHFTLKLEDGPGALSWSARWADWHVSSD